MNHKHPLLLHCAETIKGGIATYLRDLIPLQCKQMGAESIVVIIPESQASELEVPPGVRKILFKDGGPRIIRSLALALAVVSFVRAWRPAVIHIHSTFAGMAVRPLVALFDPAARIIYCPHGWAFDRSMGSLPRKAIAWLERVHLAFTDAVVCISGHEREVAIANGIPAAKLHIIRNGVQVSIDPRTRHSRADRQARKRILFVGRFDRQKGVDILAQALNELKDEVDAVLAGVAVLSQTSPLSLPECVTCIGWRKPDELEVLFRSADVLVVPSRWEGFGLVAAEAMRAGLPVIASRVGGLPEIVEHRITGILVEPESAAAIVDAVRSLDTLRLHDMGTAARRRILSYFSIERVHRELYELYGLRGFNPSDACLLPIATSQARLASFYQPLSLSFACADRLLVQPSAD